MRIEAYKQVQQLYKQNNASKTEKTKSTSFSDQLQISSMGKDIQVAKQALAQAPDVREEVIAPIKSAMQKGTYQVSSENFAEKILQKYNESGMN